MSDETRHDAARFYDVWNNPFDDVRFYRDQLASPNDDVLELGCGTGRVLVPLAGHCRHIQGIDHSTAMLGICRDKLSQNSIPPGRARVDQGDITDLDLGRTFDLITAPFRVMQNLETDAQVAGLLDTIRHHLAPGGRAVLNTFCPRGGPETLFEYWSAQDGTDFDEKQTPLGLMRETDDCRRFQADPLTCYPILKYELWREGEMIDHAQLHIAMRVWYPDQLISLIESHGFEITDRWGGYDGEAWGEGPELVVVFKNSTPQPAA